MMHIDEAISYVIAKFDNRGGYDEIARTISDYSQRAETAEAERDAAHTLIETIRVMLGAYPEHDTLEAVRRVMGRLQDAETERDALRADIDKAIESADYHRHTYLSIQTEIDNLKVQLEQAREDAASWRKLQADINAGVIVLEMPADDEYNSHWKAQS